MKKWLPWILTGVLALWALAALRPPTEREGFHVKGFGQLPVLLNGRVQPLDSVARNSLLTMQGRQTVYLTEVKWYERLVGKRPKTLKPAEWLLDVMMRPEESDKYKIFRVQHPDVQSLVGERKDGLVYYSYNDLAPKIDDMRSQIMPIVEAERAKKSDPQLRTPYQKDLFHVFDSLVLYQRIKNTIRREASPDFAGELQIYQEAIGPGREALMRSEMKQPYNEQDLQAIAGFFRTYQQLSNFAYALAIPPLEPQEKRDGWVNIGTSLMESMRDAKIHPAVNYFATMTKAYRERNAATFNGAVDDYRGWLADKGFNIELKKASREFLFNQAAPFYKSLTIYIIALLLGCAFWLNWSETLRRTSVWLIGLALVIHTAGLITRMVLEGRPPVTNLYSSAVFIGWGAVVLGLILERIYRDGIGAVVASFIGFTTLIIAHHLSLSGDTMAMLQAVLDTNFWLATHVVVITTGYASMFLAGALATIYILRGLFTRSLTANTSKGLTRMVYGIVCFSTLFSFVGTVLGGIWADQSWGRFWGWDPKENGALLIVLWCAVILHARWGGMIRERGLMAMAVFGNIVTAFSWFGVNMLGVGLHSYGFMDKEFPWMVGYMISQMVLIGLALIPLRHWASFRHLSAGEPADEKPKGLAPAPAAGG
ncbi:MAG: cytochrome c biogenesis protein CcsA [Verrucomicrobiota bacterium]